ncbi:FIST C-terminal domain-containing protein [Oculatella sp. LEGE 06141]|uniref:FIST signal transduction protein n=1 Tax=Oculatella sp. LEGE 06141 TaxID=1828648 RepID=UPI001882BE03|nr:FIST N-terminal domain-containing protein [Oculatella sp. LEGE 06141]MBE9180540.1 FIST C-terminal domain-containing protein [Oculatella sp. LEGE 06141]
MAELAADQMKWATALSTRPSLESAIAEVVEQAQQRLQAPADLALVFISSAFTSEYSRLMPLLAEKLKVPALIGCSGGGVVGTNQLGQTEEVEGTAAISLSLAHLPGARVTAFHVTADRLPDLDSPPNLWVDLIGVPPEDQPQFILLADPFSSGVNDLLQGLDFAYRGAIKIGGLASAASVSSRSSLFCNYQQFQEGAVGVALSGNITLEAIVAQGCRPIGPLYRVVEGERNIILKLEEEAENDRGTCGVGQIPLELLQGLFETLSEEDRVLAQHSLFIGIARNEFKQVLEQGDFLIRNLLGVDPKLGAIAIGDRVRPGQRVQFHLRDAQASAEDLESLLARYQRQADGETASSVGALMFACVGRGEGLYGEANFDSQLFNRYVPNIPLSGFFCGGEIGPVGDATFLHGYTSVFGICRQP